MRTVRALFTAVERRRLLFKDENDGLDAVARVLATHLPPLKQQARRGDSGHHRDHSRHRHTGYEGSENNGGPVCPLGLCFTSSASVTSTTDLGSAVSQSSSTSTGAEASSAVVTTDPSLSDSLSPQSTSASDIAYTPSSSFLMSSDSAATPNPSADSTLTSFSSSSLQPTNHTSTPLLSMLPAPSTSSASSVPDESPASSSSKTTAAERANKTGAIAGGVIGGIVFLILFILGFILFLRRRRRKRTPASAEFRDYYIQRSGGVPLAAQGSVQNFDETDAPPPPFTQGSFSDPLLEKIRETRQAHIDYGLAI